MGQIITFNIQCSTRKTQRLTKTVIHFRGTHVLYSQVVSTTSAPVEETSWPWPCIGWAVLFNTLDYIKWVQFLFSVTDDGLCNSTCCCLLVRSGRRVCSWRLLCFESLKLDRIDLSRTVEIVNWQPIGFLIGIALHFSTIILVLWHL